MANKKNMTLTPEQFNKLVTKDEFNELKDEMIDMKGDVKLLINAIDGLTKNVDDIKQAFVSNQAAHDRLEGRITKVEKHLDITPNLYVRDGE